MRKYSTLILAIAGGLLLWAAWPVSPFTLLIFIAWLPLLALFDRVKKNRHFFGLAYLQMLIWNACTTWWIWNSTAEGAVSAILANSLIMCIPWMLARLTKKQFGQWIGYGSVVLYWLGFEYIHLNWELSWPWLTLGNAFASHPGWVQWYEYTGTAGGSLWILLSNVLAYAIFAEYRKNGRTTPYFITMAAWLLLLVLPILISKGIASAESERLQHVQKADNGNIVIVQPNIDPYTKFSAGEEEAQLHKLISMSDSAVDTNTVLIIWPETAVPVQSDEEQLKNNFFLKPLWGFLKDHPQLNLLTGLEGYRVFKTRHSVYAVEFPNEPGVFYEAYNSAVLMDSSQYQVYHKSKLVPGVETLPSFLYFMAPLFEKFGGTTGGYARDKNRTVLVASRSNYQIAPAVCYESIYGEFMTGFIRNGANIICIITNDGWWGNTSGHKQHMDYARLRAIETRKWVARSANTGISCFIDPLGNVMDPLPWDTAQTLRQTIPTDDYETFFVRHGDTLSPAAGLVALLLTIITLGNWLIKKFRKRNGKMA